MGRYFELVDKMDIRGRWLLDTPVDEKSKELNPWQFEGPWMGSHRT
jgi:hypothetical protein